MRVHEHAADHDYNRQLIIKSKLYQHATMTNDTARSLITDAVQNTTDGAIVRLPKLSSLSRSIDRKMK
jgi:hypothetical protein